ncbi:MAG: DUF2891 domain-containing protein [Pirellulaceae bacterium]|nr:DUF2891 domain-containing protein [Pirellulaceae bacterium]
MRIRFILLLAVFMMHIDVSMAQEADLPKLGDPLTETQVSAFADLALQGMDQEFPNKPSNVMVDAQSVQSPKEMHPAFYGCFDWHSSIHGHWMLVRLLRLYPNHPRMAEIRAKLNEHLSAENLAKEADYFAMKQNRSFERMYGWAWAFRLMAELKEWDDAQGNQWRANLQPLEKILLERISDYLPKLAYPIRTGVHPDTAFALGQTLDYARAVGNQELEKLVLERSRDYYLNDVDYPSNYEPSGEDFFSAGLNEADLMRRVLEPQAFSAWLKAFMPSLGQSNDHRLLQPVEVSDVTDGKIVHLAGLDLSRAWCLQGVASALGDDDPRKQILLEAAKAHAQVGFRYVFSGHYEGEHWLATFAVYALTKVGM